METLNINLSYTVVKDIYENFYIDKDFAYCKNMHENDYPLLTFKEVKRKVFNDLLTNKSNLLNGYISNLKYDYSLMLEDFGEDDECVILYEREIKELEGVLKIAVNNHNLR